MEQCRVYHDSAKWSGNVAVKHRASLEALGFTIVDCPTSDKKEALDKKVLVDVALFAAATQAPRSVVLAASDGDYAYLLSRCRQLGVHCVNVRGERSAARGHTRSACDLYRECLELTPRDSYAWLALCKVMQRTNATAHEIRGTFAQADECNSVHIAHAWARFEEDEGHVEDARNLYERALTLDPDSAYVRHAWGLLERKHNNPTRALEIFEGGTDQRGLLAVAAAETRFHGDERGLRDALLEVLGTSPSRHDAGRRDRRRPCVQGADRHAR